MGDSDYSEESWSFSQKPLPVLRLLQESSNGRPLKSPGKSLGQISANDKENYPVLTKIRDIRYLTACSNKEKSVDESEFLSPDTLSSTLAVQQSNQGTPERLRPVLFSTHNLSAISALTNSAQNVSTSPQDRYRTPKRRDVFDPSSSANTPSSGSSNRQGSSSHEASGSLRYVHTPSVASLRTPSSGSSRGASTPNRGTSTPGRGLLSTPGGSISSGTPGSSSAWSSRSGIRYNPFESHDTVDQLHLHCMSPSVFAVVQSPSSQETTVNDQFWSIEQQAELYPVHISEDSPKKQTINHRYFRKEAESKTQEQIELYFSTYHDITSPPDLAPTGPLKLDTSPDRDVSYTQPDSGKCSKWTQTCLTLPPVLPAPVENVLRQYGLIMNIDDDGANNLSNSTLRRKLFNADNNMFSDADESSPLPSSSDSEDETGSPVAVLTPGKMLRTPVMAKTSGLTSAQWSSSPLRGPMACGSAGRHRWTSHSPPELGSPMFSPIRKGKTATIDNNKGSAEEVNCCRHDILEKITETSEFCMTINMDTQSSSSSESAGQQDSSMPGASQETAVAAANTSSSIPIGCEAGGGNKMQEWRRKNSAEFYDSMTMSQNSFVTVSTVSPSCSSMLEAAADAPGDNEIWGSPPQDVNAFRQFRQINENQSGNGAEYTIAEDSVGLTLPTLAEEDSNMNTESRVDTGYTTNTVSSFQPSNFQEDSNQPSSLVQDSGVSTSQPPSLTVSLILPQMNGGGAGGGHGGAMMGGEGREHEPSHQPMEENPQNGQALVSYAAEGIDISVGFPLGSSTPTRK